MENKNPFEVGDKVRIAKEDLHNENFSRKGTGYTFTIRQIVDRDWCREHANDSSGVRYNLLELAEKKEIFRKGKFNTITRAVKENNPMILTESGLSLFEVSTRIFDNFCLQFISNITCDGLKCFPDNCPFNKSGGHTVETAKKWILGNSLESKMTTKTVSEPKVTKIVDKKKYFNEEKELSLKDLLS